MELKKLVQVTAMMGALSGLYGCSGDEDVDIVIDAQDNSVENNTTVEGGDDSSVDCPDFSFAREVNDVSVCQLDPQILADADLTSDITWYLGGTVVVGNGNQEMSEVDGILAEDATPVTDVTISIEAGTQILAETGSFANLTITRGSAIEALGTADNPIVFSSDDEGEDGSGEWGGLILHGYGLHNVCRYVGDTGGTDDDEPTVDVACNVDAEGESGFAGGHDNTDSSGTLQYVVVTEGGFEFAVGNEINGISFVAVGSGTTVENIQVNGNADDGVEFYGGAVSAKYLVLTGNADDTIDWDEGWIGNIQFALVRQSDGGGDFTIEADTEGSSRFLSEPTIMNATFISSGVEEVAHNLKDGTGGYIHNSIIAARDGATLDFCVLLSGDSVQANAADASIYYGNIVADCGAFETSDSSTESTVLSTNGNAVNVNVVTDITFNSLWAAENVEAMGVDVVDVEAISPVADAAFFDDTDYVGAVDPAATTAWWEGWIVDGSLDP